MYLIVGLGNPESDYGKTRHNMGFNTVNLLAKMYNIDITKTKFNSLYGNGMIHDEKVIVVKPQTFMNLSGEAVRDFSNYYKIETENILVIYDDIDLEPGRIRVRKSGSPGSHNGMKSVVNSLKTQDFPRVRVGIGKPQNGRNLIEYVIGAIDEVDIPKLEDGVKLAVKAIDEILKNNIDIAMNKFN